MPAVRPREAARLESLLRAQLGLYGQLDGLSQRQRTCIDAQDSESLIEVLQQRQSLVDRILNTNVQIEPLLERSEQRVHEEIARLIDAVRSLARSIAERDASDRDTLQARRDAVADQLASLGRRRGAVQAYGGAQPSGPRFQDREV
ncbi:MAG: flagellar export chaperone FlgN [Planctomycetota bacterium]